MGFHKRLLIFKSNVGEHEMFDGLQVSEIECRLTRPYRNEAFFAQLENLTAM